MDSDLAPASQVNDTNKLIYSWLNAGNDSKRPGSFCQCLILEEDNISNGEVVAGQVPFFSGLEAVAVTVLPGLPEIGCEVSNKVPPTESGQLDVTEFFLGSHLQTLANKKVSSYQFSRSFW